MLRASPQIFVSVKIRFIKIDFFGLISEKVLTISEYMPK